jgi:glycosyltransferase involved in cell wall biosynthesis
MELKISLVVFAVFAAATLVQLFYYLVYFLKVATYKEATNLNGTPPVSVVICAKNEAQNLQKNIPLFFQQDYPQFQIVVVNDCSVDESSDILEEFQKKYPNLHVVDLNEDEIKAHDKKLALTLGIKGARYEHLLLTDADCLPLNDQWISAMAKHFTTEKQIVIGYGPYKNASGLLNKLIRFDTYYIGLQYLSCALGGKTYMGIGRNLGYTKSVFFNNRGFASQYHIQSGDDDLFINKVATKSNTSVEISHASLTLSNPKGTYKSWINQKRRHVTTAKHYKGEDKFWLGTLSLSQYVFFASFIALLFSSFDKITVLSIFGLRLLVQLLIFRKSMILMKEKDLFFISPLLEILLLLIYPFIMIGNIFVKKHKWK